MLEVTGGAMATLIPANTSVDWPDHYLGSQLALENAQKAEQLVQQVKGHDQHCSDWHADAAAGGPQGGDVLISLWIRVGSQWLVEVAGTAAE
jgi:hypothetical protein